jgi:anti-sigma regulatory factor (Ser/Thr protein kinase)
VAEKESMVITFEIESRLDQVRLIRAGLNGVLEHLRVTEPDIMSMELAVTEVVNNCVEHGYAGGQQDTVKVKVEVRGELVRVDVIDSAPAFPPEARHRLEKALADPNDLDAADNEWPVRGRGLWIVKQIVDSIALKFEDHKNVMTVLKNVVIREADE